MYCFLKAMLFWLSELMRGLSVGVFVPKRLAKLVLNSIFFINIFLISYFRSSSYCFFISFSLIFTSIKEG